MESRVKVYTKTASARKGHPVMLKSVNDVAGKKMLLIFAVY